MQPHVLQLKVADRNTIELTEDMYVFFGISRKKRPEAHSAQGYTYIAGGGG